MHPRSRIDAAVTDAGHVNRTLKATAPALLGYFLRRTDSAEDAADLVNETLLSAWRSARRMPGDDEAARMWLFGVARNALRHHQRGQRRRQAVVAELSKVIAAAPRLMADDDAIEVRVAVESLPPELAELIRLVHWDGFSIEQAAKLMRIPASTARSRHSRAKSLLRSLLDTNRGRAHPRGALVENANS